MAHLKVSSTEGNYDIYPGHSRIFFGMIEISYEATSPMSSTFTPRLKLVTTPEYFYRNTSGEPEALIPSHYWRASKIETLPVAFALWNSPHIVIKKGGKKLVETGQMHELMIELVEDSQDPA